MFSARKSHARVTEPRGVEYDNKWQETIALIDAGIKKLYSDFENAFAEGQLRQLPGKEYIKVTLFRHVWRKLSERSYEQFGNVSELDNYYKGIHDSLDDTIKSFCQHQQNQRIILTYGITNPISDAKHNMLVSLINLYHSLVRNQFLLSHMQQLPSPEKIGNKMIGFSIQSQTTNEAVNALDSRAVFDEHVDPQIMMNNRVIAILEQRGYGQITVEDFVDSPRYDTSSDSKYSMFYAGLTKLPSVSDINAVLNDNELSKAQIKAELQRLIRDMEVVKKALADITKDMVNGYEVSAHKMQDHFDSLKLMLQKLRTRTDEHEAVFSAIKLLRKALRHEKEQYDESLEPRLINAIIAARDMAYGQSTKEKIIKGPWTTAGDSAAEVVGAIIKNCNAAMADYAQSYDIFKEAASTLNADVDKLRVARETLQEWHQIIEQTRVIFDAVDVSIQVMQTKLNNMYETTGQYVLGFLKRNILPILVGGTSMSGAGAAVAFILLSGGTAPAVLIPAGFVIGGAGGAGVGLLKDHVKPPKPVDAKIEDTADIEERTSSIFNQRSIFERLFGEAYSKEYLQEQAEVDPHKHDNNRDEKDDLSNLNIDWSSSNSGNDGLDLFEAELFPGDEVTFGSPDNNNNKKPVHVFRM